MNRSFAFAVAAAFGLGGAVGAFALLFASPATGCRRAEHRPARLDRSAVALSHGSVGQGQAFQCKAADCGTEVHLYLRAKLGSCNCVAGVGRRRARSHERLRSCRRASCGSRRRAPDNGRPHEGAQPGLCSRKLRFARQNCDLSGIQRSLRYGRCYSSPARRPSSFNRTQGNRVSEQRYSDAMD